MTESAVSYAVDSSGVGSVPDYAARTINLEQLERGAGLLNEALRIFKEHSGMIAQRDNFVQCRHQDFFKVFDRAGIVFKERGGVDYPWEAEAYVGGVCFVTLVDRDDIIWLLEKAYYTAAELRQLLPVRRTLDEILREFTEKI